MSDTRIPPVIPSPIPIPPVVSTATPQMFFQAARSFRSRKAIVAMVLVSLLALHFWWLASLPPLPGTRKSWLPAMLAILATVMAVGIIRQVIKGGKQELVISTDGISYGRFQWPWTQIILITTVRRSFSSNYHLQIRVAGQPALHASTTRPADVSPSAPTLCTPAGGSHPVMLLFDQPWPQSEVHRVFAALHPWLQTHYPHIKVG